MAGRLRLIGSCCSFLCFECPNKSNFSFVVVVIIEMFDFGPCGLLRFLSLLFSSCRLNVGGHKLYARMSACCLGIVDYPGTAVFFSDGDKMLLEIRCGLGRISDRWIRRLAV